MWITLFSKSKSGKNVLYSRVYIVYKIYIFVDIGCLITISFVVNVITVYLHYLLYHVHRKNTKLVDVILSNDNIFKRFFHFLKVYDIFSDKICTCTETFSYFLVQFIIYHTKPRCKKIKIDIRTWFLSMGYAKRIHILWLQIRILFTHTGTKLIYYVM